MHTWAEAGWKRSSRAGGCIRRLPFCYPTVRCGRRADLVCGRAPGGRPMGVCLSGKGRRRRRRRRSSFRRTTRRGRSRSWRMSDSTGHPWRASWQRASSRSAAAGSCKAGPSRPRPAARARRPRPSGCTAHSVNACALHGRAFRQPGGAEPLTQGQPTFSPVQLGRETTPRRASLLALRPTPRPPTVGGTRGGRVARTPRACWRCAAARVVPVHRTSPGRV